MRRIRLDEWIKTTDAGKGMPGHEGRGSNKKRRRPIQKWKLMDSIIYIRMRNEYLEREGILVKVGDRRWRLRS